MNKYIVLTLSALVIGLGSYLIAQDPIPAKEELVIPAEPEKRFPAYWVRNLQVRATSATDGQFYLELLPYDPTSGAVDPTRVKELRGDLWQLIASKNEAGVAMRAIFAAVPKIEEYLEEKAAADLAAAEAAAANNNEPENPAVVTPE